MIIEDSQLVSDKTVFASIVIYKHSYLDLKPTLDSLSNTPSIQKIILIDNDQSDWAQTLNNEKIVYIKSEGNFGFGYGHNLAIQQYAKASDFFLICNPDIAFEANEFEKLLNFAAKSDAGLFLPRIYKGDGVDQYGARLLPTPMNLFARRFSPAFGEKLDQNYLLKKFSINKPIFAPNLIGCFMLFASHALLDLGGFDERFFMYMEDVDLSRRCAEKYGAIYYPLAYITHLHEQGSYKNKTLLKAHLKSAYQYFNKWGWLIDTKRDQINEECLKQFKNI
ncbi:glycosyltransferase [Acinetobacter baumannii]|uniref:Glycosyltransferase n=1 Tax=Acinetobacter baumannii TaxID=470 RepID=A0A7S8F8A6_ACIBA|nr:MULTISPECIES: glycosyltransferase [Acinetobacter calcoaceticus/baumannii complex]KMV25999.1 glycosyl transferase 2 family protein [Acinetobacter baumannii]MCT9270381.1 glycosyltransferase [Acinetobacter baumannii]MDN8319310.1 glycosyltransferase [Acinetobacter baumannii]QPD01066.1 glycosyltransferase [Acinetobacter baumannii]